MKIITAIKSWLFREKHSAHHWRKYLSETSLLGCRDTDTCREAGIDAAHNGWQGALWPGRWAEFVLHVGRMCAPCPCQTPGLLSSPGSILLIASGAALPSSTKHPRHQAPSTPRPGPHAGAAVERLWCAQSLQFMMNTLNGGLRDGLAGQGAGWHSLVLRRQCLLILPRQP